MRKLYRAELVVNTVLGPQRAKIEGVAEDMWRAIGAVAEAYEAQEAETKEGPREVIGLVIQCVGIVADKPIVLGPDGEPLEQDMEEGDAKGTEGVDGEHHTGELEDVPGADDSREPPPSAKQDAGEGPVQPV